MLSPSRRSCFSKSCPAKCRERAHGTARALPWLDRISFDDFRAGGSRVFHCGHQETHRDTLLLIQGVDAETCHRPRPRVPCPAAFEPMESFTRRNGAPADRRIIEIRENAHGYALFYERIQGPCAVSLRAELELRVPHSPSHAGTIREWWMRAPEDCEVIHRFQRHGAESKGETGVLPGLLVGLKVHRIISSRVRVCGRGGHAVDRVQLRQHLPPIACKNWTNCPCENAMGVRKRGNQAAKTDDLLTLSYLRAIFSFEQPFK